MEIGMFKGMFGNCVSLSHFVVLICYKVWITDMSKILHKMSCRPECILDMISNEMGERSCTS